MSHKADVGALFFFLFALAPIGTRELRQSMAPNIRQPRTLNFEDRVAAQRAIEEVYWRHRIWPEQNPRHKPALEEVLPEPAIRAEVEDYLRKSGALEALWGRPIQAGQLQAEIERMARRSRQPELLEELFSALGNDPFLIAECLARPLLADRLIHAWYSRDACFRGELKGRVEAAIASSKTLQELERSGGILSEVTWRVGSAAPGAFRSVSGTAPPDRATPSGRRARASEASGYGEPPQPPERSKRGSARITTATVSWRRPPFDVWWEREKARFPNKIEPPSATYDPPRMLISPCTDDTWASTRSDVPDPRTGSTAVWTGTEMIVWGGFNGVALNTGGRYNPSTDTWTQTSTEAGVPTAKSGHTAVWAGSRMIVWGGGTNTGGRYDPASDSWSPTSTGANVPSARREHTAVWTGSEMIVWGGYQGTTNLLATGGRYDPASDSWIPTSTGENVPSARTKHTAVWTGSEMIVWAGENRDPLSSGGRYSPSLDAWTPTSQEANLPQRRSGHTGVWTGSEMIVWGGGTSTGGRYSPSTNSWVPTSRGPVFPRGYQTALWTGTEMIVWGGISGNWVNSGARYSPSTDSWSPTSRGANVPSARYYHTSVWTGTAMIVWGGQSEAGAESTGGRYNPATNKWTATSTGANLPDPRYWHTAVWTGSEMIVWGGEDFVSTGGRYNPSTDRWTPTSTGASVPSGRHDHTAVWTGSEMIVWGGLGAGHEQTGGRYNPSTDLWTPTSTGVGVPEGRYDHTAVWTGSAMIVWGGFVPTPDYYSDTGGLYDPATDSWKTTSTGKNVPSGRAHHTAVWTGSEMIVWGGDVQPPGYLATGGRYRPADGTWRTMSPSGVPIPRRFHTAVWAGSEMIVWGGDPTTGTGGRYCAAGACAVGAWFRDADGDGFGNPTDTVLSCSNPAGYIVAGGDCDDADPLVHPGATDGCNGVDDDCDGQVDEAHVPQSTSCGVGACASAGNTLCVNGHVQDSCTPGQPTAEVCDGEDNNCDGNVPAGEADGDGDGSRVCEGDCDETREDIYPDAPEVNDGIDNQCPGDAGFGVIDEVGEGEGFTHPNNKNLFCWPGQQGATTYRIVRSTSPVFAAGSCFVDMSTADCYLDPSVPPAGEGYFYLVRTEAPLVGSWGQDSQGNERTSTCGL